MNTRVLQATNELSTATANFKRAEKESQRERRPMPKALRDHHMADIRLYEGNLSQAEAAAYAMNRFPPVSR